MSDVTVRDSWHFSGDAVRFPQGVKLNPEAVSGVRQMVPHSLNSTNSDGGSQILWEDGERVFRRGWRLDDNGKRRDVLMVIPAAGHLSRSSLDHLSHEYELRYELDGVWAVRPLDLVRDAGRTMLILEDTGCEPLARVLDA